MSWEMSEQQRNQEAQMASVERALLFVSSARKRVAREIAALERIDDVAPHLVEALRRVLDELGETHTKAMHGTYFHVSDDDLASAKAERLAAEARFAERNSPEVPESQGSLL